MSLLGFGGVRRTRLTLYQNIGYLMNSGKTNGAGIVSTICCLSVYGSSLPVASKRDVHRNTSFFLTRKRCLASKKGDRGVIYSFSHGNNGILGHGNGRCRQLSSRIKLIPTIVMSPTSDTLVDSTTSRQHHCLGTFVSRLSQDCLTTIVHCGTILTRHGQLLGGVPSRAVLRVCSVRLIRRNRQVRTQEQRFTRQLRPITTRCCHVLSNSHRRIKLRCGSRLGSHPFNRVLLTTQRGSLIGRFAASNVRHSSLILQVNNCPLHGCNSRNRRGSFLVTLGLTRCAVITRRGNRGPVLLLSSLFSGLSTKHIRRLVQLISRSSFKRVIVASYGPAHLHQVLSGTNKTCSLFAIRGNNVKRRATATKTPTYNKRLPTRRHTGRTTSRAQRTKPRRTKTTRKVQATTIRNRISRSLHGTTSTNRGSNKGSTHKASATSATSNKGRKTQ